jgi:hypothetical protein
MTTHNNLMQKKKNNERANAYNHRTGKCRPMETATDCSLYLGVFIAERALSKFFDHIERMPTNNPGFDFLCGRGYKIDVKSACLTHTPNQYWMVVINKNEAADYFLILLFDNRENLNPQHVLLVPGMVINHLTGISISNNPRYFAKWLQYEQPLDKVLTCCNAMRGKKY